MNNGHINKVRIRAVANRLGELKNKVVFVGGATLSLYADHQVLEARPTDDIDVIIEIVNYGERTALEEKLREIGFRHDVASGVICRYRIEGIIVDVVEEIIVDIMPTDDPTIGFRNVWYSEGYINAIEHTIHNICTIKILSAPYFIATKLEAFKGRGKGNGIQSHDFEDIVFVLENRHSIWNELSQATESVKKYLQHEFGQLLAKEDFFEWIDCHVERMSPPASYYIFEQLQKFVAE